MSKYWAHHDEQHNMAEYVRNSTFPVTKSIHSSVLVPKPVSTSTVSSLVNCTCGPISSPTDVFRPAFGTTCSSDWNPLSVAAHLHLLGEALSLIGLHLKETNVSGVFFFVFYRIGEFFYSLSVERWM